MKILQNQLNAMDELKNLPQSSSSTPSDHSSANNIPKEVFDHWKRGSRFFNEICPQDYRNAHLSRSDTWQLPWVKKAKIWARRPISVIISGSFGTGKTWFAFAMLKEMFFQTSANQMIWPEYYTSQEFDSRLLRSTLGEFGDSHEIHRAQQADLLFLDDLGRGEKRQGNTKQLSERLIGQLIQVFNYRHENRKPTVITTNWNLSTIAENIDGSIASRMQTWENFKFDGPDRRSM